MPFWDIPDHIYEAVLDPRVPLTIATLYAITAKSLNAFNTSRNKKPWRISKTRPFKVFVVAHNIFLAVYSAWTFVGMFKTLRNSIANPSGPDGIAGTVDSLCKLQGTQGLGNAVYYNSTLEGWSSNPSAVSASLAPSRGDAGRIWNEGLAFYGWWFYLSKFYEVFDTFIILAKGKLSSTLQTYHHAGAMMCMWAGMRYMSAPIWMFAFANSFIHAIMYTYYTLTAFNIKVPMVIKRSLTTMQITQFLVGGTYAMAHSFISYAIPVSTSVVASTPVPEVASASISPIADAAAGAIDNIKSIIWGSASATEPGATAAAEATIERIVEMTTSYEKIPCIATTGETFAIWLNVLYLAPLTYLFVSFFIQSYIKRSAQAAGKGKRDRRMSSNVEVVEKAGWDAATSVGHEVYDQGVEAPVATSSSSSEGEEDASVVEKKSESNGSAHGNARAKRKTGTRKS